MAVHGDIERPPCVITASFYNITENNAEPPDPNNPQNTLQLASVRSRGVELEGVATVAHGLDLHGSYAYDDEVVTYTQPASEIGKRPVLIPMIAEDKYEAEVLAPTLPLQQKMFMEMSARSTGDDLPPPSPDGAWLYFSRLPGGAQDLSWYRRRRDGAGGDVLLLGESPERRADRT
jgi:outer membrane receptor protein involved in Fe transport